MLESKVVCPEDTSLQPVLTKESSLGEWPLVAGESSPRKNSHYNKNYVFFYYLWMQNVM